MSKHQLPNFEYSQPGIKALPRSSQLSNFIKYMSTLQPQSACTFFFTSIYSVSLYWSMKYGKLNTFVLRLLVYFQTLTFQKDSFTLTLKHCRLDPLPARLEPAVEDHSLHSRGLASRLSPRLGQISWDESAIWMNLGMFLLLREPQWPKCKRRPEQILSRWSRKRNLVELCVWVKESLCGEK